MLCSIAALAAGCASNPQSPRELQRGAESIDGRISIRYKDLASGKEDALSGRFAWVTTGDALELRLLDPIGQSVALVETAPGRATVTFRDGRKVEGIDAESLTQQTLGYALPLHGLRSWLAGRAAPGSDVSRLPDGRLRQDGWTIRFVAPDDAATGQPPRRIDLEYPGPPAEIEMRLVVDARAAG